MAKLHNGQFDRSWIKIKKFNTNNPENLAP